MADGNCQISSTLYNAVLSLPSLTVIERHDPRWSPLQKDQSSGDKKPPYIQEKLHISETASEISSIS